MKERVIVFIFRRDLRLYDNRALYTVARKYKGTCILPIFIFNPLQVDKQRNSYYSQNAVEFMIESIEDMNTMMNGSLNMFYGADIQVLELLLQQVTIECVAFNSDFTPFAKSRDLQIMEWCKKKGIDVLCENDYTLFEFDKIKTGGGTHYEVFGPFYKNCISKLDKVQQPQEMRNILWYTKKIKGKLKDGSSILKEEKNIHRTVKGGRKQALDILEKVKMHVFAKYDKTRDYPALDRTTKLSAYLKFGCVSIREVFWLCLHTYGKMHGLVRELIWREFYAHLTYYKPQLLAGQEGKANQPLRTKYNKIPWNDNQDHYQAWCSGKTGFPFVDAAMIAMNQTGFMHNRLRMVVSMFLTKDMMIDWRWGEKYFAQKLVDYDPASNSGGWQWSSSVGADAQPYFRIFNPWTQSKNFDPDAVFIKTWIPALRHVPAKHIHEWYKYWNKYNVNYLAPILDHSVCVEKTKSVFASFM